MTDDSSDTTAPGSGAGDSTPSTQVPRVKRPSGSTTRTGAKTGSKPKSRGSSGKAGTPSSRSTDKGRPRPATSSGDSAKDAPLSAEDYSRTTGDSPSTTAVIPAVKDDEDDVLEQARAVAASGRPSSARFEPAEPAAAAPVASERAGRAATLRLTHVEPWSVTRMAFAISVALMIVGVVATTIFWLVLDFAGVWDQISGSVTSVLSDDSSAFDITDYLGFGRLVGLSLVLSAINVVVMTVLATIAAHLYNLAAHVLGGFQVTFSNDK